MAFFLGKMEAIKAIELFLEANKLPPHMKKIIIKKIYFIKSGLLYSRNSAYRKHRGWEDSQEIIQPRHQYIKEIRINGSIGFLRFFICFSDGQNIMQHSDFRMTFVDGYFNHEVFIGLTDQIIQINERCWIDSFGNIKSKSLSINKDEFVLNNIIQINHKYKIE